MNGERKTIIFGLVIILVLSSLTAVVSSKDISNIADVQTQQDSLSQSKEVNEPIQSETIELNPIELESIEKDSELPLESASSNGSILTINASDEVDENTQFIIMVTCNGSGVANVTIIWNNEINYTNSFGYMFLTAPEVNTTTNFTITAIKDGYENASKIVSVIDTTPIILCGDTNDDNTINIVDLNWYVEKLFYWPPPPDPNPICKADINGDGNINIVDLTYLISYLFCGGSEPSVHCCD